MHTTYLPPVHHAWLSRCYSLHGKRNASWYRLQAGGKRMLLGTLSSTLCSQQLHEQQHMLCTRMALAESLGITHKHHFGVGHQHPSGLRTSIQWLHSLQLPTWARW